MKKSKAGQWKHLESAPTADEQPTLEYPSSARIKHDWGSEWTDTSTVGEEGEPANESADEFFKKLYANATEDTKRAMMKSFVTMYQKASNSSRLNLKVPS